MGYSSCLHKPCILSLACLGFSPIDCDQCEIIEEIYQESIGAEDRDSLHFVEAIERTKYDLRWKVALGLEMEEVPIQKSALQEFQARLVLHEQGEALLKKSIDEARRAGYVTSRKIRVALDTTQTLGKGAVKDTYNLLADGIEKLACRLAEVAGEAIASWAEKEGVHRYFGSSLKGEAAIDWDDKAQREQLLTQIVQDGRRLLSLAEQA